MKRYYSILATMVFMVAFSLVLSQPAHALSGFSDIALNSSLAESVEYLAEHGIVKGIGGGQFSPEVFISVRQWAVMLCRAYELESHEEPSEFGTSCIQRCLEKDWLQMAAFEEPDNRMCWSTFLESAFHVIDLPVYNYELYPEGVKLSPWENYLRIGRKLGLCRQDAVSTQLVTRGDAAELLFCMLTQSFEVSEPPQPIPNRLLFKGDHYEIDFEDLEAKAKDPKNKLLILCSPHNPTGRVWTVEELTRIGRICIDNNVMIVSDEIHNDLIMPGYHHTMFASISDEFAQHSITLTSPSKSFNLAGMQVANLIIPNEEIREKYWHEFIVTEGSPKCNILGYEACRIAYTQCDEWLDQVIELINHNRQVVIDFLAKEFPQVQVIRLEGTYLLWMDFRALGIECHELARILRDEAHLFYDDGYIFGEEGEGFERWNLACPTKYINAALERMKKALDAHLS